MQNRSVVAEQSFMLIPVPVELVLAADMFSGNMLHMTAENHKITLEVYTAEDKDEETVENNDFECSGDCDNCLIYDMCTKREADI